MGSKAFSGQHPGKPHLLRGTGLSGEVRDTRLDVDAALQILEGRDVVLQYPELDYIDGAGPAAAGGDMVLKGRYLVQGQSFATLTLWTGTSSVVITALKPGDPANDFTVQVTGTGTAGSETVTKTGDAFVVDIEPGASTANQIATAINANAADSDGYLRAASGGVGFTNAIAAAAHLAGGVGEGWECRVGGFAALPANTPGTAGAAALTETSCTVTVPALAPIVATDKAKVYVTTDDIRTDLGAVAVE